MEEILMLDSESANWIHSSRAIAALTDAKLLLSLEGNTRLSYTGFLGKFEYQFPDFFKTFSRHNFSEWPTQVKYRRYDI